MTLRNAKPKKNSVYLICPISFYNYRFEFTRYLYITFLYATETNFDTFLGENLFSMRAIL